MFSVAASRPALLAHARLPASARSTRPEAAFAAAPRCGRITIARRPLAATTMTKTAAMKSDVECSASTSSAAESFVFKASLAALAAAPPNLLFALASRADEAAAVDAGGGFKVAPLEIILALAPVVFYALLSLYRKFVNPKASIGDGLFIVAALVIVANIVSILAFHKRIY